uniref:Uncharacterized protein n=1 Tax=viral metagenome TaxID=1070528 RepID=A0A6M3IH83_9ZZZZ
MSYLGSWKLSDVLTFACNTHLASTGAATDADSVPTYRVYENETDPPILTGSMAKLDDDDTTGFYTEAITLSAANGFEIGKCYTIYIEATVSSIKGTISHTFQMQAEVSAPDISVSAIADAVWDELKSGHTTPNTFGDYLDIEVSSRLAPTVASRTLDVTANGNAGIDWGNIDNKTATQILSDTYTYQVSYVSARVDAAVIAIGESGVSNNITTKSGSNLVSFFDNANADTTKVVDDVGGGGTAPTVQEIVDGVWNEPRLDHLVASSYGEQMDWMLHKDVGRTFDRAQDSLEAIRDAMVSGGQIPSAAAIADAVWDELFAEHVAAGSYGLQVGKMTFDENNYIYAVPQDIAPTVINTIVDATWDELRADHVAEGSFGEGVITYSLATQAKADVNEQADLALTDIRLNELISLAQTAKPVADSFMDYMFNKDANQTFDRSTDSLEAIKDSQLALASIIDGTIDVQSILKRIHALLSGNGSSREGDIYTYKQASGSNYIRQTISDAEVVTALV